MEERDQQRKERRVLIETEKRRKEEAKLVGRTFNFLCTQFNILTCGPSVRSRALVGWSVGWSAN